MILLSSLLTLFTLCYTAYPHLVTFDRYPCVESLYFCRVVPCISNTNFVILSGVLRRKAIINNSRHRNNSLLQYLSILLIIHANDVNLNPGPTHNDTVHDRGVKCETCNQWYHASCQSIHTISYNQLEDTELNISWHCIICNNPNYSSTVHVYQTVDVSVDVTNDSSIPSIPPQC